MKHLIPIASIVMLISLAAIADEKQEKPNMPAPKADVYVVPKPSDIAVPLKYPAEILPYKKVQVVARVTGILEEKFYTEGEAVKQGDLLYRIEDKVYKAMVNAAKASVKLSEASLLQASKNWGRIEKLYAQKAVSDEDRDNAFSAFEQANASLAMAKAKFNQAKVDFDYTQVHAPISGITGMKKVDVGDLVTPNTVLVDITQNDKVYINFSMPYSDYSKIKNGLWKMPTNKKLKVRLEIDGELTDFYGTVDYIDVNSDRKTSVVKIRAVVPNESGYLMPGIFIRVVLENIVQENAITIPQKALLQNPKGTIVFIESKGRVDVRPVVVGRESGKNYVVTGGMLKSGDKVIVNNFFRLKPGQPVRVDHVLNASGK